MGKFDKFKKLGPKMLILAYFGPKNNGMVKMSTLYPSPYCALSSCKILGKNNEPFFEIIAKVCKKRAKKGKKGKKGAKYADFRLF